MYNITMTTFVVDDYDELRQQGPLAGVSTEIIAGNGWKTPIPLVWKPQRYIDIVAVPSSGPSPGILPTPSGVGSAREFNTSGLLRLVFNIDLNSQHIDYDGSNIDISIFTYIDTSGVALDVVDWVFDYQFGATGTLMTTPVRTQLAVPDDVSGDVVNVIKKIDLPTIKGAVGDDVLFLTIGRDGAVDTYGGKVFLIAAEINKGPMRVENFEGFTGSPTVLIGVDPNGTEYQESDPTLNGFVAVHIASNPSPGAGVDPTGQHGMVRSSTGNIDLINPLQLTSHNYTSFTISFAVMIDFVLANALHLDYSANGLFTDTVTVKSFTSTASLSGTPYEVNRWYAGELETIVDTVGGIVFTNTAKIRWRSGGFANSTKIYIDDIIIKGYI